MKYICIETFRYVHKYIKGTVYDVYTSSVGENYVSKIGIKNDFGYVGKEEFKKYFRVDREQKLRRILNARNI